jgi:hypothetical protein
MIFGEEYRAECPTLWKIPGVLQILSIHAILDVARCGSADYGSFMVHA